MKTFTVYAIKKLDNNLEHFNWNL